MAGGTFWSDDLGAITCFLRHFSLITYHSVNFAVTTANVGKRKAFSIGAEKHGVNAFSQKEIEHFECCDDDVITSGEVSEEDIVALVNEKTTLL
ncbi:hypothetical protein AVEN_153211-1 [Araneus ventricosus]|uniref:Uncharacterized protein n=1 Tax=Araneus ventricosus TaxID=182803 RepID=A0A4Y2WVM4_ARAVE|nr:hypothetical protein AVEN_153211-1 [Araneus ventricosus]